MKKKTIGFTSSKSLWFQPLVERYPKALIEKISITTSIEVHENRIVSARIRVKARANARGKGGPLW